MTGCMYFRLVIDYFSQNRYYATAFGTISLNKHTTFDTAQQCYEEFRTAYFTLKDTFPKKLSYL